MVKNIKIENLAPNEGQIEGLPKNPRFIKDDKFENLKKSLQDDPEMLNLRELLVFFYDKKYVIIGGNMRYRAAVDLGIKELPCKIIPPETPVSKLKAYTIKDNAGYGEWSWDDLANEWDADELDNWGVDVWQDDEDDENNADASNDNSKPANAPLIERFVIPPFSILDTRKGYWQDRKRSWRELIGDMGESRNDTLIQSPEIKYKDLYQRTREHREKLGIGFGEYLEKYVPDDVKERESSKILSQGVSLLDPVMAEIACRWFGLENCKTFDCFAGDSVFGYVSAYLGNEFTGIELREEQAKLNNERVTGMAARYICDDGQNVAQHIEPNSQDLLFSCPPYFDLEKYSDLENDASNQYSYENFVVILENAFKNAIACLKDDRFAVIVVGDVRDKKTGFYYNFIDDVKRMFKTNGMYLYNEIILIETGASTALRASRYMESRKVAKMHQNVLVFYKGNSKNIKQSFKKIEYASEDLELFGVDSGNEPEEN
jgi:DNA modification methylase